MASSVSDFFAGKTILITGATGFLGKVLVEKLLRSCQDVHKLYLLTRSNKDQNAEERVREMLQLKIFGNNSQKMDVNMNLKVQAIEGDISQDGLGLSHEDREILISEVNIVFHCAATVKFTEPLRNAVKMNLQAVYQIIELCRQMKALEALVHVSTAYSNCDREVINEEVYTPAIHPDKLKDALEWMNDDMVESITPHLLGNHPNTYTFTKGLAEYVLAEQAQDLPVVIFRPSIIGASLKEPVPGWVDAFNGPSCLMIAMGKGVLRTMWSEWKCVVDVVPVDIVANMLICIAWYGARNRFTSPPVFHCISGSMNPGTWGHLSHMAFLYSKKYPFENVFRRPNFALESRKRWFQWWTVICHRLPAYFVDSLAWMTGQKPRMTRQYTKLEQTLETISFFANNTFDFGSDNYQKLTAELNAKDTEVFNFDVAQINWEEYMELYILGIKKYLLKEEMSNLPEVHRHFRRRQYLRFTLCTIVALGLGWIVARHVPMVSSLWTRCSQYLSNFMWSKS